MTKQYDINSAAGRMGYTPQYVRALIRKGLLDTELVPLVKGSLVTRHMISEEEIVRYLSGAVRKSRRIDGRNKFVFYANVAEYPRIIEALKKAGLQEVAEGVRSANKLKAFGPEVSDEEVSN
jgi:hypothetical protein